MAFGTKIEFIVTDPLIRINEGWKLTDKNIQQLLKDFDSNTRYSNFEDPYDCQQAEPELQQRAFLHVVTETVFYYPHNAYGEKTFKPVSCFRPFVLVNVPGALQELRDLGFQTFSAWWDEDYDNIQDPTDRLYAVLDIVQWAYNQDLDQVKALMQEMQPVLEHNYHHYYNELVPQQLKKFSAACLKNLKFRNGHQ
jgi:hypothetical protein